jgi:hypothetical protein
MESPQNAIKADDSCRKIVAVGEGLVNNPPQGGFFALSHSASSVEAAQSCETA